MKIVEEPVTRLAEHGRIPIAYEVRSRYRTDPTDNGLSGIALVEEPVDPPYVKDYDQTSEEGPARWLGRWDMSSWGLLAAYDGTRRVGGALLARRTPKVNMLEGRDDLAVLWDLRVHPDHRGAGVGQQLFEAAVEVGAAPRLRRDENRNPEYECSRVPVLCPPGLPLERHRVPRLRGVPGRDQDDMAPAAVTGISALRPG